MSKSSDFDKVVKAYIIECMDFSGYGIDPQTDKEKVCALKDIFYSEMGWRIAQKGEVTSLTEWFMGLPSACTVAFANSEIIELAKTWGSLPQDATERQEYKIINNWFNLVANKASQLFRKYCKE